MRRLASVSAEKAAAEQAQQRDVISGLRQLGLRPDEARRAAAYCDNTVPDTPIEERLRAALSYHGRALSHRFRPASSGPGTAP